MDRRTVLEMKLGDLYGGQCTSELVRLKDIFEVLTK